MRKYAYYDCDLYISDQIDQELGKNPLEINSEVEGAQRILLGNYCKTWSYFQEKSLDSAMKHFAILSAHGDYEGNIWCYQDQGNKIPVRDWVREMDAAYSTLFLFVCNKKDERVYSRHSLLFYPDDEVTFNRIPRGRRIDLKPDYAFATIMYDPLTDKEISFFHEDYWEHKHL